MSQFTYKALMASGHSVTGSVRGRDHREAVRKLLEMGYHPLTVESSEDQARSNRDLKHLWNRWVLRIRPTDLAVFTRQMASLLKAGLPILQTLATLRKQSAHKGMTRVIEDLEVTIARDACSLTEAMEQHPEVFDPVYRGLVRSGEEGGNLPSVLDNLASYLSRFAKLRGQVVSAFIYPVFLLILGVAAVFVLLAFVIPKFEELFLSFGQELPLPTKILLATSSFLAQWWWLVGIMGLAGFGAALAGLKNLRWRQRLDQAILAAPIFGPLVLKLEISRIARTLGALLQSGIRILDALRITGNTVRNDAIRGSFGQVVNEVGRGEPLAESFEKTGMYPPLMINLIRTGESTGELREMLAELSAIYEDEADRAVTGAVKLLEPTLIVCMGLVIAGIIAAVLLPIFQANTMVQ